MRRRRLSRSRVAVLVLLAAVTLFFVLLINRSLGDAAAISLILLWVLSLAAGAIVIATQAMKGSFELSRWIRLTLRTRVWIDRKRKNLCLHCGYNLTGNLSGVCPECGEPSKGFGRSI